MPRIVILLIAVLCIAACDSGPTTAGDPRFVASSSQRCLRAVPEPTDNIPRAARDEPEQDRFEAPELVTAWSMTAQRMAVVNLGQPRFDRRPDSRDNTRMKCEHESDLHLAVVWIAP